MASDEEVLIHYIKHAPNVDLHNKRTNKHLYWAPDKNQWEVYYFDRMPHWTYKGPSLSAALNEFEKMQ